MTNSHGSTTVDPEAIDWLRGTAELARELGVSESWISQLRRIHAPHTLGRINRRRLIAKLRREAAACPP